MGVLWVVIVGCGAPGVDDGLPPDSPRPTNDTDVIDTEETEDTKDTEPVDSVDPPDPVATPDLSPGFTELAWPAWAAGELHADPTAQGSGRLAQMHWAVAGDLGDDGVMELVVANATRDDDVQPTAAHAFRLPDVTHDAAATALVNQRFGPVVAIVDVDGDGDHDVIRSSTEGTLQLADGAVWRFVDLGLPPGRERLTGLQAAAILDIDMDGWLDVGFAPDDCNMVPHLPVVALVRTGLDTWTPSWTLTIAEPEADNCALMSTPNQAGGQWLMPVGGGCDPLDNTTNFEAQGPRDDAGYRTWVAFDPTPPDAMYRVDPRTADQPIGRRQPMGAHVVDFDLDGALDVMFTLSDLHLHLFRFAEPLFADLTPHWLISNGDGPTGEPHLPWAVWTPDLDADGRPDLIVTHGDDASSFFAPVWNGPYLTQAWWNAGNDVAVDVTSAVGLDRLGNWRAMQVVDLDDDADPDLIVGGNGELPMVLRNDVASSNHRVGIRLRGTTSNHAGVGAIVKVEADGIPPQTRVMGEYASPDVIALPELYFGLASATVAHVTVTWPSGVVQEVDVDADAWRTIDEPPLITLSVPGRHVPADGASEVEVWVTPRTARGSLRSVGAVTVSLAWGTGLISAPATSSGVGWKARVQAPDRPGSAVVHVAVDGVDVPIEPRLWWNAP